MILRFFPNFDIFILKSYAESNYLFTSTKSFVFWRRKCFFMVSWLHVLLAIKKCFRSFKYHLDHAEPLSVEETVITLDVGEPFSKKCCMKWKTCWMSSKPRWCSGIFRHLGSLIYFVRPFYIFFLNFVLRMRFHMFANSFQLFLCQNVRY